LYTANATTADVNAKTITSIYRVRWTVASSRISITASTGEENIAPNDAAHAAKHPHLDDRLGPLAALAEPRA
jgi:hypothetical protein